MCICLACISCKVKLVILHIKAIKRTSQNWQKNCQINWKMFSYIVSDWSIVWQFVLRNDERQCDRTFFSSTFFAMFVRLTYGLISVRYWISMRTIRFLWQKRKTTKTKTKNKNNWQKSQNKTKTKNKNNWQKSQNKTKTKKENTRKQGTQNNRIRYPHKRISLCLRAWAWLKMWIAHFTETHNTLHGAF